MMVLQKRKTFKAIQMKKMIHRQCNVEAQCINYSVYSALLPWEFVHSCRRVVEGYNEEGRGKNILHNWQRGGMGGGGGVPDMELVFVGTTVLFEGRLKAKAAPQKWQIRLGF